jgi:hypothetical protein
MLLDSVNIFKKKILKIKKNIILILKSFITTTS